MTHRNLALKRRRRKQFKGLTLASTRGVRQAFASVRQAMPTAFDVMLLVICICELMLNTPKVVPRALLLYDELGLGTDSLHHLNWQSTCDENRLLLIPRRRAGAPKDPRLNLLPEDDYYCHHAARRHLIGAITSCAALSLYALQSFLCTHPSPLFCSHCVPVVFHVPQGLFSSVNSWAAPTTMLQSGEIEDYIHYAPRSVLSFSTSHSAGAAY